MRILVEPSDFVLHNSGDIAMLEVGVLRLSALFPRASIHVLSSVPDLFPRWAPNAHPLAAAGRHAYVAQARRQRGKGTVHIVRQGRVGRWLRWFFGAPDGSQSNQIQAFIDHVSRSDLVIATGMGGITDAFPEFAFALLATFELAMKYGAVTAMMGQGIGPLTNPDLVAYAREILPKIDLIALREKHAGEALLRAVGVPSDRIVITGDDAIEMAYERHSVETTGRALGINLRMASYAEVDGPIVARVREAVQHAARSLDVPLLPLPISRYPGEADHLTLRELLVGFDDTPDDGASIDSARKVIDQIGMCRAVVTGSYHPAVFALTLGVPVVGLAQSQYYIDKFQGLADQFGIGCEVILLDTPDLESAIAAAIERAWRSADAVRPQLLAAAARQVELQRAAYRRLPELVSARRLLTS
jgi:polysaccharide pyruvyl transferase WcaK-like protein